jgi:hypothetical protein
VGIEAHHGEHREGDPHCRGRAGGMIALLRFVLAIFVSPFKSKMRLGVLS